MEIVQKHNEAVTLNNHFVLQGQALDRCFSFDVNSFFLMPSFLLPNHKLV